MVPRGLRRLACYLSYDLVPWEGLVDSQASQPFSFVVVCTQTCYASVACMLCMLGHVTSVCNKCYDGSSGPLSI